MVTGTGTGTGVGVGQIMPVSGTSTHDMRLCCMLLCCDESAKPIEAKGSLMTY